jgi:hypothetical protein
MKKIVYTRPDGGLSIVVPAAKEKLEQQLGVLSEAQYEKHVYDRSVPPDAINPREIEDSEIPSDREFRNAWKDDSNSIGFDLDKAKDIQLERIRKAREPKLVELDKEFMLALEKGSDVSEIASKKQSLRDITEPLKALVPDNIDDIKNAFPGELKN